MFVYERGGVALQREEKFNEMYMTNVEQRARFKRNKYLLLDDILTPVQVRHLVEEVDACATWVGHTDPEKTYFLHRECSLMVGKLRRNGDEGGRCGRETNTLVMNRIENVTSATPDGMIAALALPSRSGEIRGAILADVAAQLMEEDTVLLKDKINFKQSGGGGFTAHVDEPAYFGLSSAFCTAMIAVDDATLENGCLEVAPGVEMSWDDDTRTDTVLTSEEENALTWLPLPAKRGSAIFFTGRIPHRSAANMSMKQRRAIFLTFNRAADGDRRSEYFDTKWNSIVPHALVGTDFAGKLMPLGE